MTKKKGGGEVMSLLSVLPQTNTDEAVSVIDSVRFWRSDGGQKRVRDLLFQAQRCWDSMEVFRKERKRAKMYTYGKQWQDKITVDGKVMTEEDYIKSQGSVPMSQNLIRRFTRNVLGVYRNQNKEPNAYTRDRAEQSYGEVCSTLLKYACQLNKKSTMNSKMLEDALIGGMVVEKKTAGWRQDRGRKFDVWNDKVLMDMFFIDNNATDIFCRDARMIGEIHEWTFAKVCSFFAKKKEDVYRLRDEYASANNVELLNNYYKRFGKGEDLKNIDFLSPNEAGMCRVIEIWNVETQQMLHCWDMAKGEVYDIAYEDKAELVDAVNEKRIAEGVSMGMRAEDVAVINCKREDGEDDWFVQEYWYYRFVTPFGHVLQEGESPYAHGEHPYVVFAYPFVDGEIHSFVADVIDQQRYVNRLITMYDWVMRCSAKGLLLAPEGAFDGQDIDKVAETWSSFNGVLMYKPKAGVPAPMQVSGNMTNTGIVEMLDRQMKMMEEISGVNGALQGKPGYSGMSGALYAQQTQNSTTSLIDLLESFDEFIVEGAYKDLKNILQFYDDERIRNIVDENVEWKKVEVDRIRNMEYDISVVQSTTSPVYREQTNQILMELFKTQAIGAEELLEAGQFPNADKILQMIRSRQERLQGQMGMQE